MRLGTCLSLVVAPRKNSGALCHPKQVRAYLDGYLDPGEYFRCWRKLQPATRRNFWGGLESEPVTLYGNGVSGREDWMYMVVVVPVVDDAVSCGGAACGSLTF